MIEEEDDESENEEIKEFKYAFCPHCFRAFLVDPYGRFFSKYYNVHHNSNCVAQRGVLKRK